MPEDVEVWERQPGESGPAYVAFCVYRDMGPTRTLRRVRDLHGKSWQTLSGWSKKHAWVTRTQAFDREQDRLWRIELADARRRMAERHAKLAEAAERKVARWLRDADPSKFTTGDATRLMDVAIKTSRLALGQPEGVTQQIVTGPDGGPVEFAELTDVERRARLAQLQREIAHRLAESEPAEVEEDPSEVEPE